MSFKQSFSEVVAEAKKAFEGIERTPTEVAKMYKEKKHKIKMIGFVDGMKAVKVYR